MRSCVLLVLSSLCILASGLSWTEVEVQQAWWTGDTWKSPAFWGYLPAKLGSFTLLIVIMIASLRLPSGSWSATAWILSSNSLSSSGGSKSLYAASWAHPSQDHRPPIKSPIRLHSPPLLLFHFLPSWSNGWSWGTLLCPDCAHDVFR